MMGKNNARKYIYVSFNSSKTPDSSYLGEYQHILWKQSSAPDDGQKHRPKIYVCKFQLIQDTT